GFNRVFASWCFVDGMPFSAGETTAAARMFAYIKCNFSLPSDTTVRNQVARIFLDLRAASVQSKIAYSTDTWTNAGMIFTFAGILAHWVDEDWEMVERLVDFRHLDEGDHTG
ncbi:hypothetical protein K525DRAFT_174621, partial [Schizophyllum commune Loenen D]